MTHKEQDYIKIAKIATSVNELLKKVILPIVVVVVQFQQAYLKNQLRYEDETLHKDWNPWGGVQEGFILFVNNKVCQNLPQAIHYDIDQNINSRSL